MGLQLRDEKEPVGSIELIYTSTALYVVKLPEGGTT